MRPSCAQRLPRPPACMPDDLRCCVRKSCTAHCRQLVGQGAQMLDSCAGHVCADCPPPLAPESAPGSAELTQPACAQTSPAQPVDRQQGPALVVKQQLLPSQCCPNGPLHRASRASDSAHLCCWQRANTRALSDGVQGQQAGPCQISWPSGQSTRPALYGARKRMSTARLHMAVAPLPFMPQRTKPRANASERFRVAPLQCTIVWGAHSTLHSPACAVRRGQSRR